MRVRVTREPCSQCPWKGRLNLRPGRLVELREVVMQTADGEGGVFLCHKLLHTPHGKWVAGPRATGAVCSGWRESAKRGTGGRDTAPWELQVAERLGMIEAVDA